MWWHMRRNQISSFRRNGQVHLNRQGRQFSRLLADEVCASAVVMLDPLCSKIVWRVLATHSLRQFPLHFLSRASSCAIMFQLGSTAENYPLLPATNVNIFLYILFFSYNQMWSVTGILATLIWTGHNWNQSFSD